MYINKPKYVREKSTVGTSRLALQEYTTKAVVILIHVSTTEVDLQPNNKGSNLRN
jgi:hypothetical protein